MIHRRRMAADTRAKNSTASGPLVRDERAGRPSKNHCGQRSHSDLFFDPALLCLRGSRRVMAQPQAEHSNIRRPGSLPNGAIFSVCSVTVPHLGHSGPPATRRASAMNRILFVGQWQERGVVPYPGGVQCKILPKLTAAIRQRYDFEDTERLNRPYVKRCHIQTTGVLPYQGFPG